MYTGCFESLPISQTGLWVCRFPKSFTAHSSGFSEKAMATHSSTPAWKIPWTEEPGGLQSMGSLRVGHDWATSFSLFTFMRWRRKWQPTPVFLPGESRDRGACWAAVYEAAQSRTWLKLLRSSSIWFLASKILLTFVSLFSLALMTYAFGGKTLYFHFRGVLRRKLKMCIQSSFLLLIDE